MAGKHESRGLLAIDLLQGNDVRVQLTRVAGKGGEVPRAALQPLRDIARQLPGIGRCALRDAMLFERPERLGRDEPLEIPRGELEGIARRRGSAGVSCRRCEKKKPDAQRSLRGNQCQQKSIPPGPLAPRLPVSSTVNPVHFVSSDWPLPAIGVAVATKV